MSKIKKYNLSIDNDIDYDLIGINSYHQDYRLAWNLNKTFSFYFEKSNDFFEIYNKKKEMLSFPYYYYKNEEEFLDIYLLKNKCQGKFLIPEKNQIDYFIFICNNFVVDIEDFVNKLRKIDIVLLAMVFDVKDIVSTKNIIFS